MGREFTKEQQAAIDSQGKTIVSASAGSGKTTVMIEKIIRLIKDGCHVDEILAVTFTKKAAAQMKEKLSKALISAINDASTDLEKRKSLKERLSEVPTADISTIHSFCSKLIKTHFFTAGVSNSFRVIAGDDAEGTALQAEALEELLDEGYEQKEELFAHLISVYWRKKSDKTLRKIFLETYEHLRSRADYLDYIELTKKQDERTFKDVCADLWQKLQEKCRYYYDLVENENIFFQENQGRNQQLKLCEQLLNALDEILNCKDYFEACAIQKPSFAQKSRSEKDSAEYLDHVERLGYLKEKIQDIYVSEFQATKSVKEEKEAFLNAAKTAAAVAEYLLRFDEKYAKLKAERGVLDYNDLEHIALKLLNDEAIIAEMREKYRYVFVDEYQDVNPVQEAIISKISGDNLFLVGDVKQSIYGFRGSKSRFFVEKQEEFSKIGENLYMSRNFRSSDAVLDAVNSQFVLAMTKSVCDIDYARGSFMERGGMYALSSGRVQIHLFGKDKKTRTEGRGVYSVKANTKKKETQSSRLAKAIKRIIETEYLSDYYNTEDKCMRKVSYSDIAILSRKKEGEIAKTVAALSAENIPVTSVAAVNVCEYAEIKTLIDILSLIDNAQQDIPLCSALLSAIGNLTAEDLAKIRLQYPDEDFFRNACEKYKTECADALSQKLQTFYAYFNKLRSLSRVVSAGELIATILTETDMEARLLSKQNGEMCLKRIHRFIEEASIDGGLSVHAFLARLRDLDYEIKHNENGGDNSVKVMTMHSSKGLEFPVVIVDNLSAHFRGSDKDEVLVEEKYGLAPRAFFSDKMLKSKTLLRRLYDIKDDESSIADELNLYYVALTRAQYALHMLFESRPTMANVKYANSFAEFTNFSVWEKYVVEEIEEEAEKSDIDLVPFYPDKLLTEKIIDAYEWKYPHAGYENLPVKSSASDLMREGAWKDEVQEDDTAYRAAQKAERIFGLDNPKDETDARMGTVYHAFLERFDFSILKNANDENLRSEISKTCETMAKLGIADVELLSEDKLVEILQNPIFSQLQSSKLYKEQQFTVLLPVHETYALKKGVDAILAKEKDDEEMIFQGAIDLLAVEDDCVRIIDYKYSNGGAEYLRSHYALQLYLYKKAVAKIMQIDERKISCTIVNICKGYQVEMG